MRSPDSSATHYFQAGPHRFRFEPPDIVFMYFDGAVEVEHFHEFYDTAMKLDPNGRIYIVRDTRSGGLLDGKTRSAVIKKVDPSRVAAIISYGSSFQLRVIVTMLTRAMRAFRRSVPEVVFVNSEEEARTWIDLHRKNHL